MLPNLLFLRSTEHNGQFLSPISKVKIQGRAIEMLPGKIVDAADSIMLPKESFPVAIAPLAKDFPLYFKPGSR